MHLLLTISFLCLPSVSYSLLPSHSIPFSSFLLSFLCNLPANGEQAEQASQGQSRLLSSSHNLISHSLSDCLPSHPLLFKTLLFSSGSSKFLITPCYPSPCPFPQTLFLKVLSFVLCSFPEILLLTLPISFLSHSLIPLPIPTLENLLLLKIPSMDHFVSSSIKWPQ